MQIIIAALAAGVGAFLAIALVLRAQGNWPKPPDTPMLTYVGLAFTVAVLIGHALVPSQIVTSGRRRIARGTGAAASISSSDLEQLCGLFLTQLLISAALLEGIAFFWLIVYLVEGNPLGIGIVLLCIGGILLKFPTRGAVEHWLEKQRDLLEQERQTMS
jgi:hypothetical protein